MSQVRSLRDYCALSQDEWRLGQEVTDEEFRERYSERSCRGNHRPANERGEGKHAAQCASSFGPDSEEVSGDTFREVEA